MTDDEKLTIVDALCDQALADHLGDIRDSEEILWRLIGVPALPYDHPAWDTNSAYRIAIARLKAAGVRVPEHLDNDDEEL